MRSRIAAVLASTFVFGLVLGTPAHATFPGGNGKLAYSSCGAVDCGIFVANPDGSESVQLTHNPFVIFVHGPIFLRDLGAAWSADGTKIVYARETPGGAYEEIRVVNADGTGDHSLGIRGARPVWSPDGTKIAFVDSRGIEVINADGTGATNIAEGGDPDWSPDGTRIVFARSRPGDPAADLYVMNPDGSNQVRLTFGSGPTPDLTYRYPSWSPDGTKIAFARADLSTGGPYDIYTMNADGSNVARLTTTSGRDTFPDWSPDG
jgi:TolB protein